MLISGLNNRARYRTDTHIQNDSTTQSQKAGYTIYEPANDQGPSGKVLIWHDNLYGTYLFNYAPAP